MQKVTRKLQKHAQLFAKTAKRFLFNNSRVCCASAANRINIVAPQLHNKCCLLFGARHANYVRFCDADNVA